MTDLSILGEDVIFFDQLLRLDQFSDSDLSMLDSQIQIAEQNHQESLSSISDYDNYQLQIDQDEEDALEAQEIEIELEMALELEEDLFDSELSDLHQFGSLNVLITDILTF